jgi:uncharacterized phage protein (predicted DNA packaging)
MTVSEITLAEVKKRLKIDYSADDTSLSALMDAAKAMIRDKTGRTDAEIDTYPQAYHLFMCICQHMYDSNDLTAGNDKVDAAAQCIINQMKTAGVILA